MSDTNKGCRSEMDNLDEKLNDSFNPYFEVDLKFILNFNFLNIAGKITHDSKTIHFNWYSFL